MQSLTISIAYSAVCLGWGFLIVQALGRCRIRIITDKSFSDNSSILVASGFLTGAAVISALLTVLGLIGQMRLSLAEKMKIILLAKLLRVKQSEAVRQAVDKMLEEKKHDAN